MLRRLAAFLVLLSFLVLPRFLFAQEIKGIVTANNEFVFDLYAKYKSGPGNIFFSAFSISSAFAIVYEGARGQTGNEILSVFRFPSEDSSRRQAFKVLNDRINRKDKPYKLFTANALWAQKDYVFQEDYFKIIDEYYAGKVENVDFIKATEEARLKINGWTAEKTNDRIKDLIPEGLLNSLTRLVITNAVYFKGSWAIQFPKKETKLEDFHVTFDKTTQVQMMALTGKSFQYTETQDLQAIKLPYKGNELSMVILLPKDARLDSLENSLSLEMFSSLNRNFIEKEVDVYVPSFKFEKKYYMSDTLIDMGIVEAFSDRADFSGMTASRDINIDQVIHQAFVEVNEEGTEAAAATAVVMKFASSLAGKPIVFKADHPFIFLIQDNETGEILFMGRVMNPNA